MVIFDRFLQYDFHLDKSTFLTRYFRKIKINRLIIFS